MFVTGLFQRHCSHDSPVDVVFSHFLRCSVLCLPFLFLCVVRRGVCVYVDVFSPSTTTPTPLAGIRLNPCATPLWGRPWPSGRSDSKHRSCGPDNYARSFKKSSSWCTGAKLEVKSGLAVSRLERLEKELNQLEDEEHQASFAEDLAAWVRQVVRGQGLRLTNSSLVERSSST